MAFNPIYKRNQLILGNPESSIGIVTLWTDRRRVAERLDKELYAAIGQLYSSTRGLDFLVRNLLANPQIRHLVVTGLDLSGSGQVLRDFFQNGVVKGRTPLGIECWLVKSDVEGYIDLEVPKEAIELLRKNVKPHFFNDDELVEGLRRIARSEGSKAPYSEPLIFEKKEKGTATLPGEEAVYVVRGRTVAETWVRILDTIMKFGRVSATHYDSQQKEIIDLVSVVSDEDPENLWVPDFLPMTLDYLNQYFPRVLTGREYPDCRYTYGQRLRTHFGIDQVEAIINKLCRELVSRSATAILWDPVVDNTKGGSPCLNHIWVRVVDEKLYLTATIRSNDMFEGWPENAFSLRKLQELIRTEVNKRTGREIKLGELVIVSQSAHIYDDCWEQAEIIVKEQLDKVSSREKDPRGDFIIEIEDGLIKVEHIAPSGEHLGTYRGRTARELQRMISKENLLASIDHAIYLGRELQKAEVALKYPELFLYVQDRPLRRKSL